MTEEFKRIIDEDIQDINTIFINGVVQLYVKKEGTMIPLKLAGDGLKSLLFIISAIMCNPKAIILVDEIETGYHYTMYEKLWGAIAEAATINDCQVIATTHSYECIQGAITALSEEQREEFTYIRVGKSNGQERAYVYTDELLETAILSDMEVR